MKNKTFTRLLAVLMAMLMLCSAAPAALMTVAGAANTTTSAAATKKLSKAKITYTKTLTYTGKARKPKVTVKYGKATLKKGKDYTVVYKKNTDIGVGTITIKAKSGSAYTGSKTVKFKIVPAQVKGAKAAKATTSAVKLTWTAVKGAKGYVVYSYDAATGKYTKIKATTKRAMAVRGLIADTAYQFAVRAYAKNGKTYYGKYSKLIKVRTAAVAPVVEPTTAPTTDPTTEPTTEPTEPTNPTDPTNPTNPTNPTKPTNPTDPTKPTDPTTPTVTVAKATGLQAAPAGTDVTFRWTAVAGATGYELAQYDKELGKYVCYSSVAATEATLKKLEAGSTYQFAVRAFVVDDAGQKTYGDYSDPVTVTIEAEKPVEAPAKVTGVSAAKTGAAVNLSWTEASGASVYEVATKDGTTYKKVTEVTGTSAKLTDLERHKELQLVVRAVAKSGTKPVYGEYSDPVSVTVYNADYYGAAFRSGTFRMTMMMDMDGTGEQPVNMAFKNGNLDFSATIAMTESMKLPVEVRILHNGKKIYMKLGSGSLAVWYDATEMMEEGGEFGDLSGMMDMGTMFDGFDFGNGQDIVMSTETKNGKTYEVETVQSDSGTVKIYTINNDLRMIETQDAYGKQVVQISNFSTDVSDDLFAEPKNASNLKELMDMLEMFGG